MIVLASVQRTGSTYLSQLLGFSGAEYFREGVDRETAWWTCKSEGFAKIHAWQLRQFNLDDLLPRIPAKYVFLTRKDKVGQAISLTRAVQTGGFTSDTPVSIEPTYNKDQIIGALDHIRQGEQLWEEFFTRYGFRPFRIDYEEIQDKISGLLTFLNITKTSISPLRVQRDEVTEEFRERFNRDMCGGAGQQTTAAGLGNAAG